MYLILIKTNSLCSDDCCTYTSVFTDSLVDVARAFRDGSDRVKVYQLGALVEIHEVELKEITKEMAGEDE